MEGRTVASCDICGEADYLVERCRLRICTGCVRAIDRLARRILSVPGRRRQWRSYQYAVEILKEQVRR